MEENIFSITFATRRSRAVWAGRCRQNVVVERRRRFPLPSFACCFSPPPPSMHHFSPKRDGGREGGRGNEPWKKVGPPADITAIPFPPSPSSDMLLLRTFVRHRTVLQYSSSSFSAAACCCVPRPSSLQFFRLLPAPVFWLEGEVGMPPFSCRRHPPFLQPAASADM